MTFNTEVFFLFAIVFFAVYFTIPARFQNLACLLGSCVFYGWWDWRFLFLLLASIAGNYIAGLALARPGTPARQRSVIALSIFFNLSLLGFFKYFNFFVESAQDLLALIGLPASGSTLEIILPVGISFYTFQAMSYVLDIKRGKVQPERDFITFAVFISLFPQLVAGPIVRAATLLPQLRQTRRFRWSNLLLGLEMILAGLALKMVLADNLALPVSLAFSNSDSVGGLFLLNAALLFTFQIYGDFAGYSLIAIGLGRIMGLRFPVNFRRPLLACSFQDFWRRWHISLSSWLRDYLYIPLGGSRRGPFITARNIAITILLGGLWHGAAWTYLFWGVLHSLFLTVERLIRPLDRLRQGALATTLTARLICPLFVFACVTFAFLFFRAESFDQALFILAEIARGDLSDFAGLPKKFLIGFSWGLVLCLLFIELLAEHPRSRNAFRRARGARLLLALGLALSIPLFGNFNGIQFIYFQF